MTIKNIIFFYPGKVTGGAEYLFLRYADFLSKNTERYKIMYVDYNDGFVYKQLLGKSVKLIDYQEGQLVEIPEDSLVVFSLHMISCYKNYVKFDADRTAFLFWALHFKNLSCRVISSRNVRLITKRDTKRVAKELDYLSDAGVIKYLGYGAYIKIASDFQAHPHRVPVIPLVVPTTRFENDSRGYGELGSTVRFCWLGRLDEEKSLNIITYMNEIEAISEKRKVSLSIIGLGLAMDNLREVAKSYSYPINFVGEKRDKDLDDFIYSSVDIGLASGTSSLEFGLRKKPVIEQSIIPCIRKAGESRDYIHVYDSRKVDYTITTHLLNYSNGTFLQKFDDIISNYTEACEKTFSYAMSFSVSNGSKQFLSAVELLENTYTPQVRQHLELMSGILWKYHRMLSLLSRIKALLSLKFLRKG